MLSARGAPGPTMDLDLDVDLPERLVQRVHKLIRHPGREAKRRLDLDGEEKVVHQGLTVHRQSHQRGVLITFGWSPSGTLITFEWSPVAWQMTPSSSMRWQRDRALAVPGGFGAVGAVGSVGAVGAAELFPRTSS